MITLPNKPKIIEKEKNKSVFIINACYPGYGTTLGNAFRRVLLSSLPGTAITSIKIKGVKHEFSTIPHVIEDVVLIILNLKQVRIRLCVDNKEQILLKAFLKVKGEREVKAGDIKTTPELEIINKDLHIASLTDKKADLEIEMDIESGLGYSSIEQRKNKKIEIGRIAIDAIFSPVKRVNSSIENVRVGERTDYDRLSFNIETDGSITPKEAFLKAANILVDHYKIFASLSEKETKKSVIKKKSVLKKKESKKSKSILKVFDKEEKKEDLTKTKIEDLKISSRIISILNDVGIKTVAGLTRKSREDLKNIEGMGDKGIIEIKRAIGKLGLTLK